MENLLRLATIRVNDTVIVSLANARIDGACRGELLELIETCLEEGAASVVLDLGPSVVLDFAGARALTDAQKRLGQGKLTVAGLGARARTLLQSLRVHETVGIVEWWADAVEADARAA